MKLFNLLVTGAENAWEDGHYDFREDRYLKHSADHLKARFGNLDEPTRLRLMELPTLFVYEKRLNAPTRVGLVKEVLPRGRWIRAMCKLDPRRAALLPDEFENLKWKLGLSDGIVDTTHWAVREGDLHAALRGDALKKFEIAISFAGEDRSHAKELSERLKAAGVRVFYDDDERAALVGKDLIEHLHLIYASDSQHCVLFVSDSYARKWWPTHERRAALEGAFKNPDEDRLIIIRLDDTEIPGIRSTIGYLSFSLGIDQIAKDILKKVRG